MCLLIIVLLFIDVRPCSAQSHFSKEFFALYKNAYTYYWLGITEKGDIKSFQKSLDYLEQAETLLLASKARESDKREMAQRIKLLKDDVIHQYNVASNNFAGRLPLVRFLGQPPFINSASYGTYELFVPPGELASSRAVNTIGAVINQGLLTEPQLHMSVTSKKNSLPDMESATRAMFKNWYRVKVHDEAFVNRLVINAEIDSEGNEIRDINLGSLFNYLQTSLFAFTSIELYNQIDDIKFYKFKTEIYKRGELRPAQTIMHYEFVRDKRSLVPWLLICIITLMLVSVLIYFFNGLKSQSINQLLRKHFFVPIIFWLTGIVLGSAILIIAYQFKPGYQDYITYSFWWVPILFLLLTLTTIVVVKKIKSLLPWLKSRLNPTQDDLVSYSVTSVGIATVLSVGMIVYHGLNSIIYVFATIYLLALTSFIIGNHVSKSSPNMIFTLLPAIIIIPIGGYIIAGDSITAVTILISTIVLLNLLFLKISGNASSVNEDTLGEGDYYRKTRLSLEEFGNRVMKPPFFTTDVHKKIFTQIADSLLTSTKVYCFTGIEGVGKTATAIELINRIKTKNDTDTIVLKGYAEEHDWENNPYAALRIAFQDLFEINPFEDPDSQISKADVILDGLFDKVVPFSGLLFPKSKSGNYASTEDELYYMITTAIAHIAKKNQVLFFLDDIQWLDDSSVRLIKYMHKYFTENQEYRVLFIYTCRPNADALSAFSEDEVIQLRPFTQKEYHHFLRSVFSLNTESVSCIVNWIGEKNVGKGNMFWLLKVLNILYSSQQIVQHDQYYSLSDKILTNFELPVPAEYQLAVREELKKFKDYKHIIGLASLLGLEFNASIIAKALTYDYLYCIDALHLIEEQSDIIYDIPEKDGYFAFRSSFTLEAVRAEYGIIESTDPNCKLRQIIKQYNAVLATSCENELEQLSPLLLASYYYLAGTAYSEKMVQKGIKAVRYCIDTIQFEEARKYLRLVDKRVENVEKSNSILLDIAVLKIDLTTKEGRTIEIEDHECQRLLSTCADINVYHLSKFAEYYYHIRLFNKGLEVSERILKNAKVPYEEATGLFWKALCLDFQHLEQKIAIMKEALSLVNHEKSDDAEKLRSFIFNTLGEFYSRLAIENPKFKKEAVSYFKKSIDLKNRPKSMDRAGLARSYGGLGRLELYVTPSNPSKAYDYFQKDLELSQITGDVKGQVKMYSMMGACRVQEKKFSDALRYYERSKQMSMNAVDTFFAILGIIRISIEIEDNDKRQTSSSELISLFKNEQLPDFCLNELEKLMNEYSSNKFLFQLYSEVGKL